MRWEPRVLLCRGGVAEVADDAGVFPSPGEAGTGFGFAEARDEAVHLDEGRADFAEFGAEGGGEGFAAGDGGGGLPPFFPRVLPGGGVLSGSILFPPCSGDAAPMVSIARIRTRFRDSPARNDRGRCQ